MPATCADPTGEGTEASAAGGNPATSSGHGTAAPAGSRATSGAAAETDPEAVPRTPHLEARGGRTRTRSGQPRPRSRSSAAATSAASASRAASSRRTPPGAPAATGAPVRPHCRHVTSPSRFTSVVDPHDAHRSRPSVQPSVWQSGQTRTCSPATTARRQVDGPESGSTWRRPQQRHPMAAMVPPGRGPASVRRRATRGRRGSPGCVGRRPDRSRPTTGRCRPCR